MVTNRIYSFLNCFLLLVTPKKLDLVIFSVFGLTIWNRSIHMKKKRDLLKNQKFVLVEAYLNSHSVGWIDLLAYKCILMDCSENLNPCFLTFSKSDTALLIGWRKTMNHSLENLQIHSFKTSHVTWGQEDHSLLWVPSWPLILLRRRRWKKHERSSGEIQRKLGQFIWVSLFYSFKKFLNECLCCLCPS